MKKPCRLAITVEAPINKMISMLRRQTKSGARCVSEHQAFLKLLRQVKANICPR